MSSETFTLPAHAKINWILRVIGRRPDGYHELETIFQTITLHDRLAFKSSADESITLTCDEPSIPLGESNLIHRAANILRERRGIESGAEIHLEKRIPVKAGLGGGSSDAAIALLGLARLWRVEIERRELEEMCARLGADVPFFLTGGTALGSGLGTEVYALADAPRMSLLVVKPQAEISTAEAYKALSAPALTKVGGDIILSSSRPPAHFSDSLPDSLRNDFEPVIYDLEPEIMRARDALLEAGARGALLCGSGACVFGIFESVRAQERAASALRAREAGWRIFACETLSRADYLHGLEAVAATLRRASPGS